LAGSDLVEVVDVRQPDTPRLVKFLPTGNNPRGMATSANGRFGYVMNYLSRSVTVLDLVSLERVADLPVTGETLAPDVLHGKILFNTVADPRMAKVSWIACASCHADGGSDGVTWMFADGPRQTPALWNAGQTLPWHWSAALDEAQDVEDSITTIQHGLGLAPGADPPQLGAPNAGRSDDLDALAAFLRQGIRTAAVGPPVGDFDRGRALFVERGCAACHGGPTWTRSALPGAPSTLDPDGNGMVDAVLHDVGTNGVDDVRGSTGFDIPSLLNIALTLPYMHDGSLETLNAVLDSGHPTPRAPRSPLSAEDRLALLAFLRSIGPNTPPVPQP